jgi:hypothetical protein
MDYSMGNINSIPQVVVVHKKPRKNGKVFLEVFENTRVDDIINARKLKPLIPKENEILDIGVGISFVERYKKKHKL